MSLRTRPERELNSRPCIPQSVIDDCLVFWDGLAGLSVSFREGYRRNLAFFARFCRFEGLSPRDVDEAACRRFLSIARPEGSSPRAVRRLRSNIEGFFNFTRRHAVENPMFVIRRREDAERLLERLPRASCHAIVGPVLAIGVRLKADAGRRQSARKGENS